MKAGSFHGEGEKNRQMNRKLNHKSSLFLDKGAETETLHSSSSDDLSFL